MESDSCVLQHQLLPELSAVTPRRQRDTGGGFQALRAVVLADDTPLSGLLLCAAGQGLKQHYNKKCFYVSAASTRSFSCWVKPARMRLHGKKALRDNRVRPCPKMLSDRHDEAK